MDLQGTITLTDAQGKITIPFANLLRITIVKLQPFMEAYFAETGNLDIPGFNKWMSDKLGMTGTSVLL